MAEFESHDFGSRTTLGRVTAGAIMAGPAGAIVGGLFKKDSSRVYVTITFADGEIVVVDAPRKNGPKLQQFARDVSAAGIKYAPEPVASDEKREEGYPSRWRAKLPS